MKRILLSALAMIVGIILFIAFFGVPLHAQRTNTFYVYEFRGQGASTVAAMTVKAQAACTAGYKCVLVFDPILAVYPLGTMPSKGASEFWADYAGVTGVSDLGGSVSSGLADPGGTGPIKRTTAGVTALANSNDITGVSYCLDTSSSSTAYACSLSPVPPAYVTGACYRIKVGLANTTAATVNFNSLGAKTIKKVSSGVTTDLVANDLRAGQVATVCYDGTNMQMQSQLGNAATGTAVGGANVYTTSHTIGASDMNKMVVMNCPSAPCTLLIPPPSSNQDTFAIVDIGGWGAGLGFSSGTPHFNGGSLPIYDFRTPIYFWSDGTDYYGNMPAGLGDKTATVYGSNPSGTVCAEMNADGSISKAASNVPCPSGTSSNAAGADTQVQYNDGGTVLGADSGYTYNKTTHVVTATGGYQAGSGSGAANGIDIGADTAGAITFEGSSADANEGRLSATNPTADRSWVLPDADTKIPVIPQVVTVAGPTAARTYTFPDANASLYSDQSKTDTLQAAQYCTDAGANDTYACSLSPAITAYTTGVAYRFKAATANTGAATINLNSLGAKTIKKKTSGITTDLDDNDIRAGAWVTVVYDGTNMQCTGGCDGNAPVGGSGYATVKDEGTSQTQRTAVNFTGAGVTCSDNAGTSTTDCNIPGGSGSPATFFQSSIETAVSSAGPATNAYVVFGHTFNSSITFSVFTVNIATNDNSANRYAICVYDGSGNLQAKAETLNASATGLLEASVSGAPVTLSAGRYYIAITGNANVAKFGIGSGSYYTDVWPSAPATIGSGGGTTCSASVTLPSHSTWSLGRQLWFALR
jgi:hypothetical protein